jgi:hypothetical protein
MNNFAMVNIIARMNEYVAMNNKYRAGCTDVRPTLSTLVAGSPVTPPINTNFALGLVKSDLPSILPRSQHLLC